MLEAATAPEGARARARARLGAAGAGAAARPRARGRGAQRAPPARAARAGLASLLALAAPSAPPAVCEAALDALCAAATHAPARPALAAAGAVPAAAAVVAGSKDAEVLVRALMLVGMLAGAGAGARSQLIEAEGGRAAVRLLGLARQSQDDDCRVGRRACASRGRRACAVWRRMPNGGGRSGGCRRVVQPVSIAHHACTHARRPTRPPTRSSRGTCCSC